MLFDTPFRSVPKKKNLIWDSRIEFGQTEPKLIPLKQRFFRIENRCETDPFGHFFRFNQLKNLEGKKLKRRDKNLQTPSKKHYLNKFWIGIVERNRFPKLIRLKLNVH